MKITPARNPARNSTGTRYRLLPPGRLVATAMHRGKHVLHVALRHVRVVLEHFVHADAILAHDLHIGVLTLELVHAFADPCFVNRGEFGCMRRRGKHREQTEGEDDKWIARRADHDSSITHGSIRHSGSPS